MSKIIISIEGNIGVGKTTFMDIIKKHFWGFHFLNYKKMNNK